MLKRYYATPEQTTTVTFLKPCKYFSYHLQSNLKSSKFAWSENGDPTPNYLSFHSELHSDHIRDAEIEVVNSSSHLRILN